MSGVRVGMGPRRRCDPSRRLRPPRHDRQHLGFVNIDEETPAIARTSDRDRFAADVPPAIDPAPGFPDYRFSLANERTYLAWIRTALALVAAGVAAAKALDFHHELARWLVA